MKFPTSCPHVACDPFSLRSYHQTAQRKWLTRGRWLTLWNCKTRSPIPCLQPGRVQVLAVCSSLPFAPSPCPSNKHLHSFQLQLTQKDRDADPEEAESADQGSGRSSLNHFSNAWRCFSASGPCAQNLLEAMASWNGKLHAWRL